MPCEGAESFRWRPWLCQALSLALHAAFFLAGGFLLTVAAEFGVDAGRGREPTELQEMHAEVEIVEHETTPKVLPVAEEPVVTEEPAREGGTGYGGRTEHPGRSPRARDATRSGTVTYGHTRAIRGTRGGSVGSTRTCSHSDCQAAAAKSSRFRHARQLDAKGEGSPVQSCGSGERGSVGPCGLLAEPSSALPRRSEAKPTARSSLFRVVVSAAGQAESVKLIKSSGHRILDNSALDAVRKWKFHPATLGGVKVSSTVKVPVRFRLD